jgi:hypothetical protein
LKNSYFFANFKKALDKHAGTQYNKPEQPHKKSGVLKAKANG